MMRRALFTEASVSKEKRASTSVETLPGTIFKISVPNCTRRLSRVASTCSSTVLPCFLPYSTAASISLAYSGFLDAARMSEGLVVASWGLYLSMVAKSPESQTTVYADGVSIFSWAGFIVYREKMAEQVRHLRGECGVVGVLTVPEAFN